MPKELRNFATEAKLEEKIKEYFEWADANNKPYSMARLAKFLGCDRKTLYNYEDKEFFGEKIKDARNEIIAYLEEKLLEHGTAGQIFLAKNYGYSDKQEIESKNLNTNYSLSEEKLDLSRLSDEELDNLERLFEKAKSK